MSPIVLALLVALGGGVGSTLRFALDMMIPARVRARFPWGTMLINISGSFALGLLAGPLSSFAWGSVITVGLLGGYTTFSAASLETVSMAEDGHWAKAVGYGLGTLLFTVLAALVGVTLSL